jgi:uncharacterized membrane protein YccC
MAGLHELLDRLELLLTEMEQLDQPLRDRVFEVLDGVDTLHRLALGRLAAQLDAADLRRLHESDPAIAWLLDAYDIAPPEPLSPTPVDIGPTRRR